MRRIFQLSAILVFSALGSAMLPIVTSASCSGSCGHQMQVVTNTGNSVIYNKALTSIQPGTGLSATAYMSRNVAPYSDVVGNGFANASCGDYIDNQYNPNGYGLPATYQFYIYVSGNRCDNPGIGSAFQHYHPYTPNPTPYTVHWYPGLVVGCFSLEPAGLSGTCPS